MIRQYLNIRKIIKQIYTLFKNYQEIIVVLQKYSIVKVIYNIIYKKDDYIKEAYYICKTRYAEGKIAGLFENSKHLWRKFSGIDDDIYEF